MSSQGDEIVRALALLAKHPEIVDTLVSLRGGAPSPVVAAAPLLTVRELARKYVDAKGKFKKSAETDESRAVAVLGTKIMYGGKLTPLGDLPAGAVTGALLNSEYRQARETRGKTRYGRPPSTATINNEVNLVRAWFTWGWKNGHVPSRIIDAEIVDPENIKEGNRIESEDALRYIIEHHKCTPLDRALILLLVDTGLREMEAIDLEWTQFNHTTGRYAVMKTKSDEPRITRLSPRALEAVRALPRFDESPHVFTNPRTGRRYHPRYLYARFERMMTAAGVKAHDGSKITFHSLRHTFAYWARVHWKLPRAVIRKMMGHLTDSTLDRYGIVDEEEVMQGFDDRDAYLANAARRGPRPALAIVPSADDLAK